MSMRHAFNFTGLYFSAVQCHSNNVEEPTTPLFHMLLSFMLEGGKDHNHFDAPTLSVRGQELCKLYKAEVTQFLQRFLLKMSRFIHN